MSERMTDAKEINVDETNIARYAVSVGNIPLMPSIVS